MNRPQTRRVVIKGIPVGGIREWIAVHLILLAGRIAGAKVWIYKARRKPEPVLIGPKMDANEVTAAQIAFEDMHDKIRTGK